MRIAIVTGASSGMGVEFARQIDEKLELDEIWLVARRKERLDAVCKSINRAKGVPIALDLTSENDIGQLKDKIVKEKPDIRVLVNNAGYGLIGEFAGQDIKAQLDMIDLNVRALVEITYCCLPFMKSGSHVLQVGSVFGHLPGVARWAVYAATKAFVSSFSAALYKELKVSGIGVTAVTPAGVKTEFGGVAGAGRFDLSNNGAEPADVVRQALKDAFDNKMFSIFGFDARLSAFLPRILTKETMLKIVSSGGSPDQTINNYYKARAARLIKGFEKSLKPVRQILQERYGSERAKKIAANARQRYEKLIPILPYVGGDNQAMMTQRILFAASCLAIYRAMKDDGIGITDIGQAIYDSVVRDYSTFPKNILSRLNGRLLFSDMNKSALKKAALISQERKYPDSGVMTFIEGDGTSFDYGLDFSECPIKKFLEKQGAAELTTYLCRTDFPVSRANSSGLFRKSTLADGGQACDKRFRRKGPVAENINSNP
jgi:uncharacterized protein